MTEYTDVPATNVLYQESQQVARALEYLQAGGSLSSMIVMPSIEPGPAMGMPVQVVVPPPTDPALVAELVTWLNQRLVDIGAELTSLGITVPPPAQMLASQATSFRMPPPPIPPRPVTEHTEGRTQ